MEGSQEVHTQQDSEQFVPLDSHKVKELIDLYVAGDGEASLPVLQSIGPLIYSVLGHYRIPPNVEHDDIYSELVSVLLSSLHNYNPELSEFTTWVYNIVIRRLPKIINDIAGVKRVSRSDEDGTQSIVRYSAQQMPEDIEALDRDHSDMNEEDYELLSDAAYLIKASLTPYERQVYLDYLEDTAPAVIVERANTYLDGYHGEGSHKVMDHSDIYATIANCTERIKEEFRQRGLLDPATGELQRTMFER